mgnify:CR=1 FL=1
MSISAADLRILETSMSAYLERSWQAVKIEDKSDAASHPAPVLSDDTLHVFATLGTGAQAADRCHQASDGLNLPANRE